MVDPIKPFIVKTDASAIAIGVVLLQDAHPIAFESKNLNLVQCNIWLMSTNYLQSFKL